MKKEERPESRLSYLIGAVINLLVFYAIQKIPEWNIVFITEEYREVQGLLSFSVLVQAVGGLVLMVLHTVRMHHLLHVIFNFITMYVLYRLIVVFPFDFAAAGLPFVGPVLRVLLIISLMAALIGLISNMYRLRIIIREKRRG